MVISLGETSFWAIVRFKLCIGPHIAELSHYSLLFPNLFKYLTWFLLSIFVLEWLSDAQRLLCFKILIKGFPTCKKAPLKMLRYDMRLKMAPLYVCQLLMLPNIKTINNVCCWCIKILNNFYQKKEVLLSKSLQ